jgi:inorganic phosphate transporter, PiT family
VNGNQTAGEYCVRSLDAEFAGRESEEVGNDVVLGLVVLTALAFDFTNGFHDTGNAMATTIATGALRPRIAVALSGVLNLVGAFLSLAVAATIASGLVDTKLVTLTVVAAGLIGAIVWNLLTWFFGIPSSSSQALIGGVIGAMLAAAGSQAVKWHSLVAKVILPAVLAPVIAVLVAGTGTWLLYRISRGLTSGGRSHGFRIGQIGSASMVSLAHGTNDAQKTMGVIVLTLVAGGQLAAGSGVPFWVKATCAAAVALGTFSGGWRVIRTLGTKVTHVEAGQGFSAETSSATTILSSAYFGFSLSTTQVVSGGVVGAGLGRAGGVVQWAVVRRMVLTWVVTLPAAGLMGAAAEGTISAAPSDTVGVALVGALALAVVTFLALRARRSSVNAGNVIDAIPPDDDPIFPDKSVVPAVAAAS